MKIYHGVVVNNQDPLRQGRVQVNITELDGTSDGVDNVANEALAWAEVMGSTAFGNVSGIGVSSVLHNGTNVYVVYSEDNTSNTPIVLGTIQGIAKVGENGQVDPNSEFPYADRVNQTSVNADMATDNDSYGYTQMIETRSGHKLIFGDVKNNEYVKIIHSSGSFITMDKDGNIFINSVKNLVETVEKDYTLQVGGNMKVNVKGNSIHHTAGTYNGTTDSDYAWKIGGKHDQTIGGTSNIKIGGNLTTNCPNIIADTPTADFTGAVNIQSAVNCASTGTFTGDVIGQNVTLANHTHPYQVPAHPAGSSPTGASIPSAGPASVSISPGTAEIPALDLCTIKDGCTVIKEYKSGTQEMSDGSTRTIHMYKLADDTSIVITEDKDGTKFMNSVMKNRAAKVQYDVSSKDSSYMADFVAGNKPSADDNSNKVQGSIPLKKAT